MPTTTNGLKFIEKAENPLHVFLGRPRACDFCASFEQPVP
jgi:hypothetical protein